METTPPSTFWTRLQEAVSLADYRPRPAEDVTASEQEGQYVLKSPRAGAYTRLAPEEYALWKMLDGQRSVRELAVAYFLQFQRFMPVAELVRRLRQGHLLADPPTRLREQLQAAVREQEEPWGRRILNLLWGHPLCIRGTDRFFRTLYRWGGRWLFSRPAVWLQRLLALLGLAAFLLLLWWGRQGYEVLQAGRSYFWGLLLLFLMNAVTLSLHESAHALATIHNGCEVRRGGLMLYLGLPTLFVDTTDTWMADKQGRIQVAAAGPWNDLVLGGLCALLALPGWASGPLWLKFATLFYASAFFNLNPLLELDGYFMLSDWLDQPYLRRDALEFVRKELWKRWQSGQSLERRERLYSVYGLLAILYVIVVGGLVFIFWRSQVRLMAADLLGRGLWGRVLLGLLLALLALPLLFLAARRLYRAGRQAWQALGERGFLGQGRIRLGLVAAATLLAGLLYGLLPRSWQDLLLPFLPLLLHGLGLLTLTLLLPFYQGTPFRRVLIYLGVTILLLALGSALEWAWGIVWLGSYAVRLAQPGALLIALAAFSAEDLLRAHWMEKIAMGLALAGGFVLAVALVLPAGPGGLAAALWAGGPAFLGGLALALLVPTVTSFLHTPFAPSWDLFFLALLISLARLLPGVTVAVAFALDLGIALLVAQAGLLYLLAQRYLRYRGEDWVETPLVMGSHTRLRHAFIHFFNSLFLLFQHTFGRRKAQGLDDRLDVLSVTANWLVSVDVGHIREDPRIETFPLARLAGQYIALLGHTVDLMDDLAGSPFLRRAIQTAYDGLPWSEREALAQWVLSRTPWGEAISQDFLSQKELDLRLLAQVPMFYVCDEPLLAQLRAASQEQRLSPGQVVVRQGQTVRDLWVVASGEVEVWQSDESGRERLLEEHHRGDTFGEDALVGGQTYPGTYRTSVETVLLRIEGGALEDILQTQPVPSERIRTRARLLAWLDGVGLFQGLPRRELRALAGRLERVDVPAGEMLVRQGQSIQTLYLIESGRLLRIKDWGEESTDIEQELGPGEYFGALSTLLGSEAQASIVASEASTLWALPAKAFDRLLEHSSLSGKF
ncbi:MAG: cyclic nucleotide-binding domain-containing protein [Chloroflexia bacterium]|nr:cyclic nucleotide-binding domain-containing protein [Chloroflexia bacterium]